MSYRIEHVTRYVAVCQVDSCMWAQEHRTEEAATKDVERHVTEWHDASFRCPLVLDYDDSIGGEGLIRCGASGEFVDANTSWVCTQGHVTNTQADDCRVRRCPCPHLAVGA